MANFVWALTYDGHLTKCFADDEHRGKGSCKHVAHQAAGQTLEEFMDSIEERMAEEGGEVGPTGSDPSAEASGVKYDIYGNPIYSIIKHREAVAQMPDCNEMYTRQLVEEYGITKEPDWGAVIRSLQNPFSMGNGDGTYVEAKLQEVRVEPVNGAEEHLTLVYSFEGQIYECDFGNVPIVQSDGTIVINGGKWRPLPVMEQYTAGVISHAENVVITEEGGNVAVNINKETGLITIRGIQVDPDDIRKFYLTGDRGKLTSGQVWALTHIDPYALERFPEIAQGDLSRVQRLECSDANDIMHRRVLRYEDQVAKTMRVQLRRMGVTFRSNLVKQRNARQQGTMSEEEIQETYPLFYQKNLTDNIKQDLVGRSNVQSAETLNPISALCQAQKISLTGPGGWNKDKVPNELRMPHPTHEGIVDSLVASSGKNVGLTMCVTGGYVGSDRMLHRKPEDGSHGESLSPSDFIPFKYHDDPSRANMACAHLVQACPIVGGEDPLVGTPAWDRIKGAKLGLNLKVAYCSDKDCYEDAVVLSESAAARMSTVQSQRYMCYDRKALSQLKVGQRLERKMRVGNIEVKYGGIVKTVSDEGFEVETVWPMTVGDKISNRHGGKSTVAKIRKDSDMPHIFNETTGKLEPAEIIMTPIGVVGRKNLGQVMECNQAAEMIGLHVPREGVAATDINRTGVVVNNGHRVEATCGSEYVMRLNHIAEKKLSSHADELDASRNSEGSRLGEMEHILLSTDRDRLRVLNYLRKQEAFDAHQKLRHLLHAVGVDLTGVNWGDE